MSTKASKTDSVKHPESPPQATTPLVYSAGHTSEPTEFRRPDSYADDCYTNINKTIAFIKHTEYLPGPTLLAPVTAVVHYRYKSRDDVCSYDSAKRKLMFGDGDGEVVNYGFYTGTLDKVSGTYWAASYGAPLKGEAQAAALNHSMSVIFGSMCKQFDLDQKSHSASWLYCEKMSDSFPAVESLILPGTAFTGDRQVSMLSVRDFKPTENNAQDVLSLSGVSNHAFCLISLLLGGYSWERAGKIWYQSMEEGKKLSTVDFGTFAKTTIEMAEKLGKVERRLVNDAWLAVGVTPSSAK